MFDRLQLEEKQRRSLIMAEEQLHSPAIFFCHEIDADNPQDPL